MLMFREKLQVFSDEDMKKLFSLFTDLLRDPDQCEAFEDCEVTFNLATNVIVLEYRAVERDRFVGPLYDFELDVLDSATYFEKDNATC